MNLPSLHDPVLVGRLSTLLEQLVRRLRSISAVGGISQSVAAALSRLGAEGPLRVTELAHAEGVSQPAMTQLVARMENDRLVARETPQGDRRSVLVGLTDHGRDVLEQRRARRVAFLDDLLRGLSPGDRAAIAAALPALERLIGPAPTAKPETTTKEEESRR